MWDRRSWPPQSGRSLGPLRSPSPLAKAARLGSAPQRFLGLVLALALVALFFAISAAQVTAPTAGRRIQERTVVILTEVDDLLPRVYPAWQEEARASDRPELPVPAFPIEVRVPTAAVLSLPLPELRTLVVSQAGERLYREGLGVLAVEGTPRVEGLSPPGMVHRGLGLISDEMHQVFRAMAVAAGVVVAALAALLLVRSGMGGLLTVGVAVLGAAVPSLLAAAILRFLLGALADGQGDPFAFALLDLGEEIMGLPVRNYIAFSLLGLALVLIALVISRVEAMVRRFPAGSAAAGEGEGMP